MSPLNFALSQLLKHPGFTAVAVLTLALGIGANTAIFSVLHAVVLRPFSYPESERIHFVRVIDRTDDRKWLRGGIFDFQFAIGDTPSVALLTLTHRHPSRPKE